MQKITLILSTLSLLPSVLAHPGLVKRAPTVSWDDSCNQKIDGKSSYATHPDFKDKTKKDVIQRAFADAKKLAETGATVDKTDPAFTHYFGGVKTEIQYDHFINMMGAVNSASYNVEFECSGTGGDCNVAGSLANTDPKPVKEAGDKRTVHICKIFWTRPETRYLLETKDEHQAPYRTENNDRNGWCMQSESSGDASSKKADFFATAGHTILHELTHLDVVAKAAGLSGDDEGGHGTLDPQKEPGLAGARKFLDLYKQGKTDETSPDYNAESYAAVATEKYFMNLCGFAKIKE